MKLGILSKANHVLLATTIISALVLKPSIGYGIDDSNSDSNNKKHYPIVPWVPVDSQSYLKDEAEVEVQKPLTFTEYLKMFSKHLNGLVMGQPEAVNVLLDIEKQNILNNSQRKAPEVAMFIGLPGSGKDTVVESYIQTRFAIKHSGGDFNLEHHIFRYPIVKDDKDTWTLTGSGTGYVGSDKLSALIRFLVLHSGGKYKIQMINSPGGKTEEYVVENELWKPGMVLDGYYAPEDGALFVNELHDWAKQMKNELLKEALEKGFFKIGNPGPGLDRVQVPITIFMASNDGIGLVAARDNEGNRVGTPLTEEQLMERWELNSKNKAMLKDEIARPYHSNPNGGTTEEILSRIPNSRLLLLRPLTKKTVKIIAKSKLEKVRAKFSADKAMGFPSLKLNFSDSLIEFLITYDQLSEDGARTIKDKIETLIEKPLMDAVFSDKLKLKNGDTLNLSVRSNNDGTYSLVTNKARVDIEYTEKGRNALPISDSEIDRLNELENKLNARVKGVAEIVHSLAKDIRRSANTEKAAMPELEKKTADVYAFFGVSSTGKTELAMALHQVLYDTPTKPLVIDFSQIQTVYDLKAKILGSRDQNNKSIASDFMQEYDRRNGKLVVVLDEISNANPEVLKSLYDLMREPVVQTFSDKKPRPMGQVKMVLTGNAGEEWYKGIPREASESEQLEAARRIYDSARTNEAYLRKFLMTKFSEAFINRIGLHRIFFFAPHTVKTTRELIQLKLVKAIQDFSEAKPGKRSWKIRFETTSDYEKTIESIERYGFKLWEQGASITNFINQVLISDIHDQLLLKKVANGAEVKIQHLGNYNMGDHTAVAFQLIIKGLEPIQIAVRGKAVLPQMKKNQNDIILTAFHEAGHEVVNHVLVGDKVKPAGISILPGVAEINGQWIMYDGVARHMQIETMQYTREMIVRKIAILLGGEAAEMLVTKNSRHTAGKSNDIERATQLARLSILKFGLSEKWGIVAVANNQNVDQYINGLSESKKALFEKEVQKMLHEGRSMARRVLISNFDQLFNPMARFLAIKGEVPAAILNKIYRDLEEHIVRIEDVEKVKQSVLDFDNKIKAETPQRVSRDVDFYSFVKMPQEVVNLEKLREEKRLQEVAMVDLSPGKAIVAEEAVEKSKPASAVSKPALAEKISQLLNKYPAKSGSRIRCSALMGLM